MKSIVALFVVALLGCAAAAPSGLLGLGHGVPLGTSSLVSGPSGLIASTQTNGAVAVAAPVVATPVIHAAPAVVSVGVVPALGHGIGLGHGLGLGWGQGLHGLGWGQGLHGW